MQALVYHGYGGRDRLALETVADPGAPGRGEVRVRVHATSINPVDGKVRRGELKLIAGRRFPKRPGLDLSGRVEAVGDGVTDLAVGDAVYGGARGMSEGAFAEQVITRAASLAKAPRGVDLTTAAGIPTVAIAALQALRDLARVGRGDRLLVNGCTGGVGLFALQIARQAGAVVTGVCGTDGMALARDHGADTVIDYRTTDIRRAGLRFRAILELSGRLSFADGCALLEPGGRFVDFAPGPAGLIGAALANPFRRRKHVFAMTAPRTADLDWLAGQIDAGALRACPTRVFPLAAFAEAFALAEGGGVPGKVVVRIGPGG